MLADQLRWTITRLRDAAFVLGTDGGPTADSGRNASLPEVIERVDADPPRVTGDPDHLVTIFSAFLRYAGRSGSTSGPVRIQVGESNGAVDALIFDCGPTVDRARRANLLKPNRRVTAADRDDVDLLTGIRLARDLSADVALDDTPGGGLTVELRLAAAPRSP